MSEMETVSGMDSGAVGVRAARRGDVPELVEMRVRYLGELAKTDPRVRLSADARQRCEQALPVWLGQDDRIMLVTEGPDERLTGYVIGLLTVWPPVLKHQHLGEILECYVLPEARGTGQGKALVHKLSEILRGRDAEVLRAGVPAANEGARARLEKEGFEPLHLIMKRSLESL